MRNLFIILFFFSLNAYTQSGIIWDEPIMVTDGSLGYSHPRIALDGDHNPIVIWGNDQDVQFSRWDGMNFTPSIMLDPMGMSISTASWAGPDMAAFGDTVYVVFKENPEDLARIHVVTSYDGGASFSDPVIVDGMLGDDLSRFPSITVNDEGQPLVSFMKLNSDFLEPRYVVAMSDDFGITFNMDVLASDFSGGEVCDCCPAGIVAGGNYVVNLYRDNLENLRNSWAGISSDGGNMFMNGLQIDQTDWIINACPSSGPDGIIVGDSLYSVFMSGAGGGNRVYFSRSSLSMLTDEEDIRLQEDFDGLSIQNYPRIANDGNAVAVVWKQNANTESEIAFLFTPDIRNGFPLLHDTIAFLEYYGLENADVAVDENTVHVVWQDNFNDMVMYRKGVYAEPVAIHNDNSQLLAFTFYPNPAVSFIDLSLSKHGADCVVRISDLQGRLMIDQDLTGSISTRLNIEKLNAGIYILSVLSEDGVCYSAKLIKSNSAEQ